MDNDKTLEEPKESDSGGTQSHSTEGKSSEEYLKPWMRQLGNKYFNNEQLAKYDSLSEAIDDLMGRPEKKEIPEKYDLRDGTDEIFRKAELTKAEAEEIDGFYGKMIPKKQPSLKEAFGDSYEKTMEYYSDAEKTFSSLKDSIKEEGLDKNPVFVKIMAVVGKETKGEVFDPPKETSKAKSYKELYAESFSRKQ